MYGNHSSQAIPKKLSKISRAAYEISNLLRPPEFWWKGMEMTREMNLVTHVITCSTQNHHFTIIEVKP